jgi:hypothetical protein
MFSKVQAAWTSAHIVDLEAFISLRHVYTRRFPILTELGFLDDAVRIASAIVEVYHVEARVASVACKKM